MPNKETNLWLHGLVSSLITGSSTALLSSLGVTGAAAAGVNVPNLDLKQLCIITIVGGIVGGAAYLKQSPLPPSP